MLGLLDEETRNHFVNTFDIDTTLDAEEVYRHTALHLLQYEKSSTFFCDFPLGRRLKHTPTWVPDFSTNISDSEISPILLFDCTSPHLDAQREDISISEDHLQLSVRSYLVGKVSDVIEIGNFPFSTLHPEQVVPNMISMIQVLHHIYKTLKQNARPTSEPLWKTLIAGSFGGIDDADLKDEEGCQTRFDEWMNIPLNNIISLLMQLKKAPRILNKINATLTSARCFFLRENNSYSITEPWTSVHDVLAVLFPDHYVPVIIHEQSSGFEIGGRSLFSTSTTGCSSQCQRPGASDLYDRLVPRESSAMRNQDDPVVMNVLEIE